MTQMIKEVIGKRKAGKILLIHQEGRVNTYYRGEGEYKSGIEASVTTTKRLRT